MSKKRLPIPIARFESARPLSVDVYLHLPLNQRSLKIAPTGGELEEDFLRRVRERGYTHLEISLEESESANPDTYPLYLDGNSLTAEDSVTVAGVNADAAQITVKGSDDASEGSTLVKGSAEPTEEAISVGKDAPAVTDSSTIQLVNGAGTESGTLRTNAGEPEDESAAALSGLGSSPSETSSVRPGDEAIPHASFSNEAALPDTGTSVSNEKAVSDEAQSISAELSNDAARSAGAGQSEEDEDRLIGASSADDESTELANEGKSSEVVFKISSVEKGNKESVIFKLEQKLEQAKETLLAGGEFDLHREKKNILKDAKSTILASKISDRIIQLAEQRGGEEQRQELKSLKQSLEDAEAGVELSKETESTFQIGKEMKTVETIFESKRSPSDQVIEISEHLSGFTKNMDTAKALVGDEGLEDSTDGSRSNSHRDQPLAASRLAAYLAIAMGYTNQKYLADLAFEAAQRTGSIEAADLSPRTPLAERMSQDSEPTATVMEDSKNILEFLTLYFTDLECDRSAKEFTKKVFDRTLVNFLEAEKVNSWTAKRWSGFVERGPSLESYSLCSRAAAHALKLARSVS